MDPPLIEGGRGLGSSRRHAPERDPPDGDDYAVHTDRRSRGQAGFRSSSPERRRREAFQSSDDRRHRDQREVPDRRGRSREDFRSSSPERRRDRDRQDFGRPASVDEDDATAGGGGADPDALDLEEVNRLAAEEGYELVYFSKESGLIAFEPAGRGDDDGDDDAAASDGARIDVRWTAGTVTTRLGRSRFERRGVGPRRLLEIFRNPLAAAARGGDDGRYEMAPRDDSLPDDGHDDDVALLREANRMLRERLTASQTVQVTGPRGEPVYASGSFRDGRRTGGGFWGVDLAMARSDDNDDEAVAGSETREVPLSALEDVEIRLGGVLYASAHSHEVHAQTDEQDWDGETRKEVSCHFGGPVTGVWLPVRIEGWPESHWSGVQGRDLARRRNDYRQNLDVYDTLLEEVHTLYPQATLSFYRLSFFGECVEQMVERLGLAPPPGVKQDEEELWNIANLIVATLREAGNDDVGEEFMRRVNDVQMAAYMMLTMDDGGDGADNEAVEAEIPTLVRLQLDSRSTADFLSRVGTRYDMSRLSGRR